MVASSTFYYKGTELPLSGIERVLIGMMFVAVCLLFLDFQANTIAKIRLFDVVAVPTSASLIAYNVIKGRYNVSQGALFVVLALFYFAVSAYRISIENLIRELLQFVTVAMFCYALSFYATGINWKKALKYFGIYGLFVVVAIAAWNIAQGSFVGYKDSTAGKAMFTLGLPALMAYLMLKRQNATIWTLLLIAAAAVFLVYAGERKAQIALVVCILLLALARYIKWSTLIVIVLVGAAGIGTIATTNPYLQRQFNFFIKGSDAKNLTLSQFAAPPPGTSQSNLQREFVNRVSGDIIRENPVFGIGTNAFKPYLIERWGSYIPPYMQLAIHNEFQRALVENGGIGLFLYVLPWALSLLWLVANFRQIEVRTTAYYLMCFACLFIFCAFEASGTRAFVCYVFAGLLPAFFLPATISGPAIWFERRRVASRTKFTRRYQSADS